MASDYESDASIRAMNAEGMNDLRAIGITSSESGVSGISDVSGVSDVTGSSVTPSVSSAESALTPSITPSATPSSATPSATPAPLVTPSEAPIPQLLRPMPARPRATAPRRKSAQVIEPRRWVTEKKLKKTDNPVVYALERYKMWHFVPVLTFPHTLAFTYSLHMVMCIYLGFLTFFCVIFFFNIFILASVFSRKRSLALVAAVSCVPASVIFFMYGLHMVNHIPDRSRPSEWPAPTARNCFVLFAFNILGSYSFLVLAGFIPMTKKKLVKKSEKSPKPVTPAKPGNPVEQQNQEKQEKPETAEKKSVKPKRRPKKPVGMHKIFY